MAGLTNKYNVWASTLDKADVDVMHNRIENGANLLKEHCFQFDFLNDDFDKLPEGLRKIINDPKKRKKLVVYINPPYAEAASADRKGNKKGVSKSKIQEKYKSLLGKASNELFIQFLLRIYVDICGCHLANFSKLKNLQALNFSDFRNFFLAKLEKLFIVPADTFDNVSGQFPIGFQVWNTNAKKKFEYINSDIYDEKGHFIGQKRFYSYENVKYINDWYRQFYDAKGYEIGILNMRGNDFQNQNYIYISSENNFNHTSIITLKNLIPACIYIAVRHCIPATWLNDRDQFLYPNDGWKIDVEFQNDCLAYTLFNNNISSKHGTNHWIPFIEWDVSPRDRFDSHFMTDFISKEEYSFREPPSIFCKKALRIKTKLMFSEAARKVFRAGKELWGYYHSQPKSNPNASFYDIREHFQGRDVNGKMKNKSDDEKYNELIGSLREALKELAKKIEPKVYEYGFLKA